MKPKLTRKPRNTFTLSPASPFLPFSVRFFCPLLRGVVWLERSSVGAVRKQQTDVGEVGRGGKGGNRINVCILGWWWRVGKLVCTLSVNICYGVRLRHSGAAR